MQSFTAQSLGAAECSLDRLPTTEADTAEAVNSIRSLLTQEPDRREGERLRADGLPLIAVQFVQALNGQAHRVKVRNISPGGLAFLHNQPAGIQTRCRVWLLDKSQQAHACEGTIVRCDHVLGQVHEIAVQLDRRIDPVQFI